MGNSESVQDLKDQSFAFAVIAYARRRGKFRELDGKSLADLGRAVRDTEWLEAIDKYAEENITSSERNINSFLQEVFQAVLRNGGGGGGDSSRIEYNERARARAPASGAGRGGGGRARVESSSSEDGSSYDSSSDDSSDSEMVSDSD